jgi:hypothetical protein
LKIFVFISSQWSSHILTVNDGILLISPPIGNYLEIDYENRANSFVPLRESTVEKKSVGFFKKKQPHIRIKLENGMSFRLKIKNDKNQVC